MQLITRAQISLALLSAKFFRGRKLTREDRRTVAECLVAVAGGKSVAIASENRKEAERLARESRRLATRLGFDPKRVLGGKDRRELSEINPHMAVIMDVSVLTRQSWVEISA